MTIKVSSDGSVVLNAEMPVFIGATSNEGHFPPAGEPLRDFYFKPNKGTFGTLVFDRANKNSRSPATATFYHYWYEGDKLIVKSGLRVDSLQPYDWTPTEGIMFLVDSPYTVYFTGRYRNNIRAYGLCQVSVINMLLYLERKISLEQLTESYIKE